MADWHEAVQASLIALIFALMVAKLLSVVISFRADNLRVEREAPEKDGLFSEVGEIVVEDNSSSSSESENWDENETSEDTVLREVGKMVAVEETHLSLQAGALTDVKATRDDRVGLRPLVEPLKNNSNPDVQDEEAVELKAKPAVEDMNERIVEMKNEDEETQFMQSIESLGELSDSDGWEGVESSELDEKFDAAATFVATQAVGPGLKVSNETQLLLYGLYKIATEGPCTTPQPSAYKLSARAKWYAHTLDIHLTFRYTN